MTKSEEKSLTEAISDLKAEIKQLKQLLDECFPREMEVISNKELH